MTTPPILTDEQKLDELLRDLDALGPETALAVDAAASIRALREERDRAMAAIEVWQREAGSAIAAKEEAERDAGRYRWLRDGGIDELSLNLFGEGPLIKNLDAAIDAAIERKQPNPCS